MRSLRPPLRRYLITVISSAIALIVVAWMRLTASDTGLLAMFALLAAAAVIAQLRPVHLSHKTKITVEDAATFAAILLLPVPLAMLVAGSSTGLVQLARGRSSWYSRAFNVSVSVLDTGAAAFTYLALSGPEAPVDQRVGAAVAAGLVKFGVNTLLIDLVVALQMRRFPFASWQLRHGPELPYLAVLYLLGALAAFAAQRSIVALAIVIATSFTVMLSLRAAARLPVSTRRAVHAMAALIVVRSHHERVDGTGYPRGLRGSEVPIEVSIIAVADAHDAMTTDRVYRRALPWTVVRPELERERGRQWHAAVVDAFIALIEEDQAAGRAA